MKPRTRKVLQQAYEVSKGSRSFMRQGRSYDIVDQRVFDVPVGTPILALLIDTVRLTFSTRNLRNSIARV
jgi:hypothetical protein